MAVKFNVITEEPIFHSDTGFQYASYNFTNFIKKHDGLVKENIPRKRNCWNNAVAKDLFKNLKEEWIYKYGYYLKRQAELSVFFWIKTRYNKGRRHYYLVYKTINEFNLKM